MRIVQITEQDKHELGNLGQEAIEAMQAFMECLDKISGGEISQAMRAQYGERRGVPGTGPYGRRGNYRDDPGYGRRGDYRDDPGYGRRGDYHDDPGYGRRDDSGYGNRYEY